MNYLPNGCSYSDIWVSPQNWATTTSKAVLKKNWYIQCVFHDPAFKEEYPRGFPFRKKCNRGKTLAERREMVKFYIETMRELIHDFGYNPITGVYAFKKPEAQRADPVDVAKGELAQSTPVSEALLMAKEKITGVPGYINEVRIAVNRLNKSLLALHYDATPIIAFTYTQLDDAFSHMRLPAASHNKYRSYFSALFKVLKKHGCAPRNLAAELERRKEIKKPREALPVERLRQIWAHLDSCAPEFSRYCQIFFWSGTRATELFSVQRKHIRIDAQEYDVLVKKRSQYVWVTKVILQNALDLWQSAIEDAAPEDYIFSDGLVPGPVAITPRQATKRWRRHVKLKVGFLDGQLVELLNHAAAERVTADLYSGKHTFLDYMDQRQSENQFGGKMAEVISALDIDEQTKAMILSKIGGPDFDLAQRMAAHTTPTITNKVYKVGKSRRENEYLKNLKIQF